MGYHGDVPYGSVFRTPRIESMPTAICRIYTNDGFVVAADGRKQESEGGSILSDLTQKIFPITRPNVRLAYSLAGSVGITPKGTSELIFDFVKEAATATRCSAIARSKPKTLHKYAEAFYQELAHWLRSRMKKRKDAYFTEEPYQARPAGGFRIVSIFFDGYYNDVPSRAAVEFYHVNQRLHEPEVISFERPPAYGLSGYGSGRIQDCISEGDVRFAKYGIPRSGWADLNLRDAITVAENFIRAHMGEEAREVDEAIYSAVGGHIHIATITKGAGFAWVLGREPRTNSQGT